MSSVSLPSIPPPSPSITGLMASVGAMKMLLDSLTGQTGNNAAIRLQDFQSSVSSIVTGQPSTSLPGSQLLDNALTELHHIFNVEVQQIQAQLDTAREEAIADLQSQLDTNGVTLVSLQDQTSTNAAAINTEAVTRASAVSSLAGTVTSVSAVASRKRIFVQATAPPAPTQTPFDAVWIDTAHSNLFKTWNGSSWVASDDGRIGVNAAAISSETAARVTADSALGTRIDNVTTLFNGNFTTVNTQITALSTADAALGSRIDTLQTQVNGNTASITSEVTARTDAVSALGARVDTIEANVGTNSSAITNEAAARTSADGALAGQITTAQAQINTATASGNMQLIAVASPQSGVAAEFSVNVRANTGASFAQTGLRLRAMSAGGSEVLIQAGKFIISSGATSDGAGTDYIPFEITSNGLESLAKLDGSLIVTGTVTADKLVVNDLSAISANVGRLTAGKLSDASTDAASHMIIDLAAGTITGYA